MGPDRRKNNHDRSDKKRRRLEEDGDGEDSSSGCNHHSQQVITDTLCCTDVPEAKRQRVDSQDGFLEARQNPDELMAWYWTRSPEVAQRIDEEDREAKCVIEAWSSNVTIK